MKKLLLLSASMILSCAFVFAQNTQTIQEFTGQGGDRDATDIVCPGPSVYSQLPDDDNGVATTNGVLMYDNILTGPTGLVGGITFWMLEVTVHNPLTVDIIFRHDDGGGLPGDIFQAYYSVALPGTNTGETSNTFPVIEYTYIFPGPISVSAGDWVGIADYPDDLGVFHHYWATASGGDSYSILYPDMTNIYSYDFAFCLASTNLVVPVSNWALVIGIVLITAFAIFRFRRS